MKYAVSRDIFIFSSLIIPTLWPAISLGITILILCIREGISASHPSPHKAVQTGASEGPDVVNNFNDIIQYAVKLQWHFSASHHFSVNNTMQVQSP